MELKKVLLILRLIFLYFKILSFFLVNFPFIVRGAHEYQAPKRYLFPSPQLALYLVRPQIFFRGKIQKITRTSITFNSIMY